MLESEEEIRELQALIDRTVSTGGRAARLRHLRIEPTSMWTYAFHPESFPE